MKGVILAGGTGSRLLPLTRTTNKHLLPVHDRAMIEYPLRTLRNSGISEVLIVTTEGHRTAFEQYFQNHDTGLSFLEQKSAAGIADALSYAEKFAEGDDITVFLGDNILDAKFTVSKEALHGRSRIWTTVVKNSRGLGVLAQTPHGPRVIEKPPVESEGLAVIGLYQYPSNIFALISHLTVSERGELEISSLNNLLLERNLCDVLQLPTGTTWFDAGTPDSLALASAWARSESASSSQQSLSTYAA